jgi:YD repeat-containing protein
LRADIKQGRNIVKYKKGEIPRIYISALTCFETLSYTYDDKGRILKEENSDGSSVSYEYDAWGRGGSIMNFNFNNNSNISIVIKYNNNIYKIASDESVSLDSENDTIDVTLYPNGNSFLENVGKTVIGYHLYVESQFSVRLNSENCNIDLSAVGVNGDNYEYYLHIIPSSNSATINLIKCDIFDKSHIINYVEEDYSKKSKRNSSLNKHSRRNNFLMDLILDSIYSALPVIIIVYIFAHKTLSKKSMIIVMLVLWIAIVLLTQIIYKVYDCVSKKVNKNDMSKPKKAFDINMIFEDDYIKNVINDNKRYQNIK